MSLPFALGSITPAPPLENWQITPYNFPPFGEKLRLVLQRVTNLTTLLKSVSLERQQQLYQQVSDSSRSKTETNSSEDYVDYVYRSCGAVDPRPSRLKEIKSNHILFLLCPMICAHYNQVDHHMSITFSLDKLLKNCYAVSMAFEMKRAQMPE